MNDECPICKMVLMVSPQPTPRQLVICHNCAQVLKYLGDGKYRELTQSEEENMPNAWRDPITKAQVAIRNHDPVDDETDPTGYLVP